MDIRAIAAAGVPVLCVDTCSILDMMRDPTREGTKPRDRRAAIDLAAVAEAGGMICVAAEQVMIEFSEHDGRVQEEAERNLARATEQMRRINELAAVYGVTSAVDLSHLADHVARSRAVVGRWLACIKEIFPADGVHARAFARVNRGLAPAVRGKDSSKDCRVYETYLDACASLRALGLVAPVVFLSSNTREYVGEGGVLKETIAAELDALDVRFAANLDAARRFLCL